MFEQRQLGLDLHGYLRAILLLGCTVSIVSFQWNWTPYDQHLIAVEGCDIRMYWSWSRSYNERKSLNIFRKGSTEIMRRKYKNNVYTTEITVLHGQKYKLDVADGDQFGIWILNLTKEDDDKYGLRVWGDIPVHIDPEHKSDNQRFAAYYSREELGVDLMLGGIALRLVPSKPAVDRTSSKQNEWTAHNEAIQATKLSFDLTAPMKTEGMRLTGQEKQTFTKRNTTSLVGELKVEPGTSFILEVAVDYGFFYFTGHVTFKVLDSDVILKIESENVLLDPSTPTVNGESLNNEWICNTAIYSKTISFELIARSNANIEVKNGRKKICDVNDVMTCSGEIATVPGNPLILEVNVDFGQFRLQGTVTIQVEDTSVTLVIGSVELQLEPSEPAVKKKSSNNEWTSNTEIYPRTVRVNLMAPSMAKMKVNTRKKEVCYVTDATTCSGQLAVEPVSPLKLEVDVDYGTYRFQGTVRIAVEAVVKESNSTTVEKILQIPTTVEQIPKTVEKIPKTVEQILQKPTRVDQIPTTMEEFLQIPMTVKQILTTVEEILQIPTTVDQIHRGRLYQLVLLSE